MKCPKCSMEMVLQYISLGVQYEGRNAVMSSVEQHCCFSCGKIYPEAEATMTRRHMALYNPLGDAEPSVGTPVEPPRGRHYQTADDVRALREEIGRERPQTFGENRRAWQSVKDMIDDRMREAGPS